MKIIAFFGIALLIPQVNFKENQLKQARVKTAYQEKKEIVETYFSDKKLNSEGFQLFIRAFKKEQKLEVWIKEKHNATYTLLHTYDFCTSSGTLGPKRKEGDLQIPEGVYQINHFNPVSNFYLSLGLNYPNASDKILSDKQRPGGNIYIHGSCVTIGCIPITDDKIKELYILAVEAKNNGQENIPVHIFPTKLDDAGMKQLEQQFADAPKLISFWRNLEPIYKSFDDNKVLKKVITNTKGEYVLNSM
jgi:murein L,D-transpeptidase YafK